MAALDLVPVASLPSAPAAQRGWCVHVSHLLIHPCPLSWSEDRVVVYRVDKRHATSLMLPEAHFYGRCAFGVLISLTDEAVRPTRQRRFTWGTGYKLALTQPDGRPLPKLSSSYCLDARHAFCAVTRATYAAVGYGDWVRLTVDPDRTDPDRTPQQDWVYRVTDAPTPDHEDDSRRMVTLCVLQRDRDRQLRGRARPYVLSGPVVVRKHVATPRVRHAGAHIAPGYTPPVPARRTGVPLKVTTSKPVLAGEDFMVGGVALRILELHDGGFHAHRLIEKKDGVSPIPLKKE